MSTTLVGSIVGVVSARPSGASNIVDSGQSIDFAIGGLGFNLAVSDKHPYERATADFRKQQFDNAPVPGEQGLDGWWLRSQLSFHRGAGIKYYEVLDGETVLNRYWDSEGVDPWTAGKVSLVPNLADLSVTATAGVAGALSGTNGVFYTTATGLKFHDGSAVTAITTSDGGVPTDLTSDGLGFYAVNGKRIERQPTSTTQRTNHVTNPNFETDTAGWSGGVWASTLTRDTSTFYSGTASLKATDTGTTWAETAVTGLTVGVTYKVAARMKSASGLISLSARGGTVSSEHTSAGAWVLGELFFTATATSETVVIATSGIDFNVDNVMVTEAPFDGEYFDGSTIGGAWSGTANASKSTYATNAPASSYALWNLSTAGFSFANAWWAKGRLWAVDGSGRWYTLTTAGGTVANTDAFWASGITTSGWSLSESPSAVFLSNGRTIYSVTLDPDGTVPTVAAPSVAASLPAGETVSCITHYLGYLVIATNKGVRVGAVDADGLVYGPLVVSGNFSQCNEIGATDSRVFVTGQPEDHSASVVVSLDLGQMVEDLRPGWAPWQTLNNTPSPCGSLVDADGRPWAWAGNLYGAGASLAASGSLTTGFQRFGTLEPKKFHALNVRVGGGAGTIDIYRVMADGSEVSLYVIDAGTTEGEEITLSLQEPQEMLALKFVLSRDASDATLGPELLGYQLRAMPAPRRQRLIRIPLSLFDVERASSGRTSGRLGDAWERLSALEDMEQSGGTFAFRDFRTGEAGECYIEKVEHQGLTPPGRHDSGYGGVVFLTLRKL